MLHALILAGGSGTRFWPRSRKRLPKQFLSFGGERSLLQETVLRVQPLISADRTWIVTGEVHAEETQQQLPELQESQLIVEPCARNTAPCIALAALQMSAVDPDATLVVLPADHVIRPTDTLQKEIQRAAAIVEESPERLVLFGVPPAYPATGFGYIRRGELLCKGEPNAYRVAAFQEKPDATTAAAYTSSGEHFWNCGIFVWRASTILQQIEQHAPEIAERINSLRPDIGTANWITRLEAEFPRMPSISIDYAVLEKSSDVCVLPAAFAWDDVGSWQALSRLLPQDNNDNTADGLFCGLNTSHCVIGTTPDHLVATFGVRDLVIVHTPTATLVADKRNESSLRQLIAELERRGLSDYL